MGAMNNSWSAEFESKGHIRYTSRTGVLDLEGWPYVACTSVLPAVGGSRKQEARVRGLKAIQIDAEELYLAFPQKTL